jgi:hypothetical protein
MPSQDARRAPAERAADPEPSGGLSRRSVLQGAATAGVAGLAATAIGAAVSPAAAAATGASAAPSGSAAHGRSAAHGGDLKAPSGPVVVHVRNAKAGDIEVFSGTSETRLTDKDLAARIVRAIG